MRLLVTGGRYYSDRLRVWSEINALFPSVVIHGDCKTGADKLAKLWCRSTKTLDIPYPANWSLYGLRAGPIRNQQMIDEGKPNLVLAFQGGSGTADMVRRAKRAGIKVIEVRDSAHAGGK